MLATLVYLAVQVRQSRDLLEENRRITLSQMYEGRARFRGELSRDAMNLDWASISVKLRGGARPVPVSVLVANFNKLTEEEKTISMMQQGAVTQGIDNSLYQIELGLVDDLGAQGSYDFIRAEYPLWLHAQIPIPPRITKWYNTNVDPGEV